MTAAPAAPAQICLLTSPETAVGDRHGQVTPGGSGSGF